MFQSVIVINEIFSSSCGLYIITSLHNLPSLIYHLSERIDIYCSEAFIYCTPHIFITKFNIFYAFLVKYFISYVTDALLSDTPHATDDIL